MNMQPVYAKMIEKANNAINRIKPNYRDIKVIDKDTERQKYIIENKTRSKIYFNPIVTEKK